MSESRIEELFKKLTNGESIEDFQPLSRSEAYLKAALTNAGTEDLPDPVSRLDVLLAALNEKVTNPDKPYINTAEITDFKAFFFKGARIDIIDKVDFSKCSNCEAMFQESTIEEAPDLNIKKTWIDNMFRMFWKCTKLKRFDKNYLKVGGRIQSCFEGCTSLEEFDVELGPKVYNHNGMFLGCTNLKKVKTINMAGTLSCPSMFQNCTNLTELTLLNIPTNLQIGSSAGWGQLLTIDSLVNTIKELIDKGTAKTLTVGSANLAKLANVYVKLVTITDEMRAADKYIDQKLPFEVCESTDEGAMLITEYATLKQWAIA